MRIFLRLAQILISTIPLLIGLFGVMDNCNNFNYILNRVIKTLLTMQGITDLHAVSVRSIMDPEYIFLVFVGMIGAEGLVALLSFFGICIMLKNIHQDSDVFQHSKSLLFMSTLIGFFVWGALFYCIAGDYFLARENPTLKWLQPDAGFYTILMALTHLLIRPKA